MNGKYRIVQRLKYFYPQYKGILWGWNYFTNLGDGELFFHTLQEAEKYIEESDSENIVKIVKIYD